MTTTTSSTASRRAFPPAAPALALAFALLAALALPAAAQTPPGNTPSARPATPSKEPPEKHVPPDQSLRGGGPACLYLAPTRPGTAPDAGAILALLLPVVGTICFVRLARRRLARAG